MARFDVPRALVAVSIWALAGFGCGPAEIADGDPEFSGPPAFQGNLNPSNPNNPNDPGLPNNPNPSVNNPNQTEGNPNPNAPIDNGQVGNGNLGNNTGTGGASSLPNPSPSQGGTSNGEAGSANAGEAGAGNVGTPTDPTLPPDNPPPINPPPPPPDPPPPPTEPAATPAEIAAHFAALPCGAKYNALGDGGWQFCLRLADGGAACARGTETFTRVTFEGGAPVTGVAQVSGYLETRVGVVTTGGALHVGSTTGISTTPLIASGVINFSGGYHSAVALVERGNGLGVVSWTDNGAPADVALPGGVQPIQVSGNYGLACALAVTGDVYCWSAGGNHDLQQLTTTPRRMELREPVKQISVGQNGVCGVTFGDELECFQAWYSSPFLPTEGNAPNFNVRRSSFPTVRDIHSGFNQGVVVRGDGAAFYLPGGRTPPSDNPGVQFTGVTNAVAAGGDRGSACVVNGAGEVYCMIGGATTRRATLGGAPLEARAAGCPR